jgi:hypothetical protein
MSSRGYPKPRLFRPKNAHKVVGNVNNIVARSSWEWRFMLYCDNNPNVIAWGSEIKAIPYISPKDNKIHRYFVDFFIKAKDKNGQLVNYAIEIKPRTQTVKPKRNCKAMLTYMINEAKWEAANKWCEENNFIFKVMTEYDLGLKKEK